MARGFNTTHNETASVLSLARTMLQGVDRSKVESTVKTASLELILQTVIALGSRAPQADLRRNIHEQQFGTQFEAVTKARQEIERKQAMEREAAERELDRAD